MDNVTALYVCVVRDLDAARLMDALREENLPFTKLASTGGFLREGNTTFLIGVAEGRRKDVLEIIRKTCAQREEIVESTMPINEPIGPYVPQTVKVVRGGGVLFEVPINRYERF
ncbi:MAG TPA: cyclic-di-AMP receptor [Atribacteraceae bacterium]|nr:cyclic-di-AMP receptor [Atribacteraceae bacterium]